MEPKQQIEQLTRELEHAGYLYYVLDIPEMSDNAYAHMIISSANSRSWKHSSRSMPRRAARHAVSAGRR